MLWRGKTLFYVFWSDCRFYHQVNLLVPWICWKMTVPLWVFTKPGFLMCGNKWKQSIFNPYSFSQKGKKSLRVALLIPLLWRCLGTLCTGRTGRRAPSTPVTKGRERKGERSCLPCTRPWTSRSWVRTGSRTVCPAFPQTLSVTVTYLSGKTLVRKMGSVEFQGLAHLSRDWLLKVEVLESCTFLWIFRPELV